MEHKNDISNKEINTNDIEMNSEKNNKNINKMKIVLNLNKFKSSKTEKEEIKDLIENNNNVKKNLNNLTDCETIDNNLSDIEEEIVKETLYKIKENLNEFNKDEMELLKSIQKINGEYINFKNKNKTNILSDKKIYRIRNIFSQKLKKSIPNMRYENDDDSENELSNEINETIYDNENKDYLNENIINLNKEININDCGNNENEKEMIELIKKKSQNLNDFNEELNYNKPNDNNKETLKINFIDNEENNEDKNKLNFEGKKIINVKEIKEQKEENNNENNSFNSKELNLNNNIIEKSKEKNKKKLDLKLSKDLEERVRNVIFDEEEKEIRNNNNIYNIIKTIEERKRNVIFNED